MRHLLDIRQFFILSRHNLFTCCLSVLCLDLRHKALLDNFQHTWSLCQQLTGPASILNWLVLITTQRPANTIGHLQKYNYLTASQESLHITASTQTLILLDGQTQQFQRTFIMWCHISQLFLKNPLSTHEKIMPLPPSDRRHMLQLIEVALFNLNTNSFVLSTY